MIAFDRKPVFAAIIDMFGRLQQAQVDRLDAAIDAGLGIMAPALPVNAVRQIGLTPADFAEAARALGCTVAQIRAVWEVESGGGWFTDVRADILAADGPGGFIDGPHLPKILFEAHIFDRETGGRFRASHPNLSSARWEKKLYVGGPAEWLRLNKAMQLDRRAALRSASVGGAQIMGFNHKLAGFDTVEAFWDAMKVSERAHLDAFAAFIRNSNLLAALRQISNVHAACVPFARGYNGQGFAANEYHIKIARAHARWSTN
ncbi:N-acetylmuramidase family protein [Blastomonas sp.]|uniref:N-acetylmuramidase family protein n=1 Tax=Blastomonas sp. TaxID=1909299 RepID=UPI0039187676